MIRKYIYILISLLVIFIGITIYSLFYGNEYTIKFNSNGGTLIDDIYVKTGDKIVLPKEPVKEGYIFIEWKYKNKVINNNIVIKNNMILDAVWAKVGEYGDYKVTFDTKGGSEISDQLVLKGEKVLQPTNPVKKGYTFKGRYLNDKKYDFDTAINENIVLTAKYEKQD